MSLADDYSEIYVFNLRGNARTAGEQRVKEKGNVFGSGARTTIAVFIGVKRAGAEGCRIHYRDIGDYLTTVEKLEIISRSEIETMDWEIIEPNSHGDWVNQRSEDFATWPVLGEKKKTGEVRFFDSFSSGLKTARDAWCYASTQKDLTENIHTLLGAYNSALVAFEAWAPQTGHTGGKESDANAFLRAHPEHGDTTKISWNRSLKTSLARGRRIHFAEGAIRKSLYRPFAQQYAYFDRDLNDMIYQLPSMFPTPHHDNLGIYQVGAGSAVPFSVIATDLLPNLHVTGAGSGGQFFPRWTWEPVDAPEGELDFGGMVASISTPGTEGEVRDGYRRVDNITDEIHTLYQEALGPDVSKDDIFYFVYGQLHDPAYREAYAADLKKMLPHIETPTDPARFHQVAVAGRELMDLHIGYEEGAPFSVDVQVKGTADPEDRETWRVSKLKWKKVRDPETKKLVDDRTTLIYNPKVTITGIPLEADEYLLGARSALAWIIDRYQVKKDKASGIVNDPNEWADEVGNPRYIVELIAKVTRVAVDTQGIVKRLAPAD
ncbi:MAG TPA: type ISP restriction/modification enzyme [Corynebacterium sp.]|nr:type ISP restriction/modification enzyme [Corynebacterium sp.]